jgi:hypothetical protein
VTHHFTPETENVEFYDVTKQNDLMAAINSLNRLICYQERRKTQLYITKVFYREFNFHDYIKNLFSSEILKKITFSDSVQSHD